MNKKTTAAVIIAVIIFIFLIIFAMSIFKGDRADLNNEYSSETYTNDEQVVLDNHVNDKYYITMTDEGIKIFYAKDMVFYDFAEININQVPDDIYRGLLQGMYIKDDDSLYEFLESYSS